MDQEKSKNQEFNFPKDLFPSLDHLSSASGSNEFNKCGHKRRKSNNASEYVQVPADQTFRADLQNSKRETKTSSYANVAPPLFPEVEDEIPGTLAHLEICKPWLQAVAELEHIRETNGGPVSKNEMIERNAANLYQKIEELFSSKENLLSRISVFTTFFFFLPRPLVPTVINSLLCVDIPKVSLFIYKLCSSTSLDEFSHDLKIMSSCIERIEIASEAKLKLLVLVFPCLLLSNFFICREGSDGALRLETTKYSIEKNFKIFEVCLNDLQETLPVETTVTEFVAAYRLAQLQFKVAFYKPRAFRNLRVPMDDVDKSFQVAQISETKKKVAKLVIIMMVSQYGHEYSNDGFHFWYDYKAKFFRIKEMFGFIGFPITFDYLREVCQGTH